MILSEWWGVFGERLRCDWAKHTPNSPKQSQTALPVAGLHQVFENDRMSMFGKCLGMFRNVSECFGVFRSVWKCLVSLHISRAAMVHGGGAIE